MSEPEPLLTEEQVSTWLGVPTETLRKLRSRGEIPYFKVGKGVRYDRVAVWAWLRRDESAEAEPVPPSPAPALSQRAQLEALRQQGLKRASAPVRSSAAGPSARTDLRVGGVRS